MIFFTLYVKEIEIAIWDAELVFTTGLKSGGTYPRGLAMGVKGVNCSMWVLRVGSGSR
jgi:hypothetical protein